MDSAHETYLVYRLGMLGGVRGALNPYKTVEDDEHEQERGSCSECVFEKALRALIWL